MNQAEIKNSGDIYEHWIKQLAKEKKAHRKWRDQAKEVSELFLSEDGTKPDSVYNLFWSNVQIIHAAVYAQTAKPDVRRRINDASDIEKSASQIIERAISYIVDTTNFDGNIDTCIDNSLVTALGVPRIKYYLSTARASWPQHLKQLVVSSIIALQLALLISRS